MKQLFTSHNICIAVGSLLVLVGVWFTAKANESTTGFLVVATCTAVAAGAFFTWAIKSFFGWRQSRS